MAKSCDRASSLKFSSVQSFGLEKVSDAFRHKNKDGKKRRVLFWSRIRKPRDKLA